MMSSIAGSWQSWGYKKGPNVKKELTDQLAAAAYEARCAALTTGAYPNRAFNIPSQNQYAHWNEIEQLDPYRAEM